MEGPRARARGSQRSTFYDEVSVSLEEERGDAEEARERKVVLPVGFRSDKFGDGVGEGRIWAHVEDGERVFAVVHAAGGENDGDEVEAGVFKERGRT